MPSSSSWSKHKAVIFDLDGTLYDNRPLHWRLPLSELFRFRLMFLSRERKARRLLRGRAFEGEEAFYQALFSLISPRHPQQVAQWYHGHYLPLQARILRRHCQPDAWVKPRLQELRAQGIRTVLYSDYSHAREKLLALGLAPALFDLIVDAPALGGLKPCRQSAQRLLDQLRLPASDVLFVGDRRECDGESARQVGAHYLQVVRQHGEVTFVP